MAELNDAQKTVLVTLLAQFRSPSEISEHFRTEEELEVSIRQVILYDPTSPYFEAGAKWRDLHAKAREEFVAATMQHSIANQSFRLAELTDLYHKAKRAKNHVLAAQLMKQAAEEVGGAFTNERNLKVTREGEVDSYEDKRRMLAGMLDDAFARHNEKAPAAATPKPPAAPQPTIQ